MVDTVFCVCIVSMLWLEVMLVLSELHALCFFCAGVLVVELVCVFLSAACVYNMVMLCGGLCGDGWVCVVLLSLLFDNRVMCWWSIHI